MMMERSVLGIVLSIGLFVGMLVVLECGYRIGRRHAQIQATAHQGIGTIDAAIFALLGLLFGFAFAGGIARLDTRRELIVREANAIQTAYLRVDILAPDDQPRMRRLFREYLEARVRVYDSLPDLTAAEQHLQRAVRLQRAIWAQAIAVSRLDQTQNVARVVLPALNEMIDVTTARTVALQAYLPRPILILLVSVALLSALVAGYAMAERQYRSPLHTLLYAVAVSITLYTVLDLDNPRVGLIRLDAADNAL